MCPTLHGDGARSISSRLIAVRKTRCCTADDADWPVQLPSTGDQASQLHHQGSVHPDRARCVKDVPVATTTSVTGVTGASTSPSTPVSTSAGRTRRVGRRPRCADRTTTVSGDQTPPPRQSAERRRRLYCGLCRVKLNADQQAEQHFAGRTHARKSKMLTLLNTGTETSASRCLQAAGTQPQV